VRLLPDGNWGTRDCNSGWQLWNCRFVSTASKAVVRKLCYATAREFRVCFIYLTTGFNLKSYFRISRINLPISMNVSVQRHFRRTSDEFCNHTFQYWRIYTEKNNFYDDKNIRNLILLSTIYFSSRPSKRQKTFGRFALWMIYFIWRDSCLRCFINFVAYMASNYSIIWTLKNQCRTTPASAWKDIPKSQ
jgi:hypothetical protein